MATCTYTMICVHWILCEIKWCHVEFHWWCCVIAIHDLYIFYCYLCHLSSVCCHVCFVILYDMVCIWILYFPLLCTCLIVHQQYLCYLCYSSFLQILHNHIWDKIYTHTHTSSVYQLFSFFFHHQHCLYQNEHISWPVKGIISPHIFLYMYWFI